MKIVITGANGMLAKAVIKRFENEELILAGSKELDITNSKKVKEFINECKPEVIINCAAYTAVDKAEEEIELARKVNCEGPRNLAIESNRNNSIFVHISTDYVFGGGLSLQKTYKEDDVKAPVTAYGITKLEGEKEVYKNANKYYILRTAWLYGEGNNFVRTMIKLGKEREEINVVADQYGSPTYTIDLADIIYKILEKKIPYGIYHTTNEGFTTWYEFAKEIFRKTNIKCKINPVTSEEFPRPAKRPKNSMLSKEKIIKEGINIPIWQDGLERYLKSNLE